MSTKELMKKNYHKNLIKIIKYLPKLNLRYYSEINDKKVINYKMSKYMYMVFNIFIILIY